MKKLNLSILNYIIDSLRKDEILMSKIYFNRLYLGTITFDAVPAKNRDAVRQYGINYVKESRMTAEEFEMLYKEEYPEE